MNTGLCVRVLFAAFLVETVHGNVRLLQRSPQQYCGSRLADMMKLICQSKYNEGKRSPMGKADTPSEMTNVLGDLQHHGKTIPLLLFENKSETDDD